MVDLDQLREMLRLLEKDYPATGPTTLDSILEVITLKTNVRFKFDKHKNCIVATAPNCYRFEGDTPTIAALKLAIALYTPEQSSGS